MSETDFYQMLLVGHTASQRDIQEAYLRLAVQYHPDKNEGNPVADEIMKRINVAYDTLSNAEKRKAYDTLALREEPRDDTPEFKAGDTVRIADSASPYGGRTGVIDKEPLKGTFRFWYMIRFQSTGFVTIVRFAQEQLERAESSV